ncbi:MAG: ATP-dependent Clp protease ATP-binding subunit [Candidatus Magasanikbacteria bacterium]|nr:ATP-dependent Clp protease ATP-binding subunit [Candidatus Magasanikbacteria bacterium]
MSTSIFQKFSTHLQQTLKNGFKIAAELRHKEMNPLHLLYGLLIEKGAVGAEILFKIGLDKEKIVSFLINIPKDNNAGLPEISNDAQKVISKAAIIAAENQHRYIGTEHLILAMVETKSALLEQFFATHKIDLNNLQQTAFNVIIGTNRFPEMTALFGSPTKEKEEVKPGAVTKPRVRKNPALDFFSFDLTGTKAQKTLDPIIGRETEITRLIQILCRRLKNNPVLLGDPGVGKTAIVEGLAQKIMAGEVPDQLQGKKIRRLDLGLLIAGTIYRGEFENRLKQLLDEVKSDPDIILFIDELHTIVGAGSASGSMDAANLLKPALARGEIRCIGATTFEEFKKHIESDAALERRFQPIIVNEPTKEETVAILRGIKENYEKFHYLKITDEAIFAAVELAGRYRQDKFFPDKAIDLLDEAGSAKKLTVKSSGVLRQQKNLEKQLREAGEKKEKAVLEENFEKALQFKDEEDLIAQKIEDLKEKINKSDKRPKTILEAKDIAKIIALSTGIPAEEIIDEEKNKLLNLEEDIKKKIIGQDEAVKEVAQSLRRARMGLSHPGRPLASFLFTGPSGVGKTELTKVLAELIFKDRDAFIRLDMSEFSEGFQTSKLIGSPVGYVGYKEGNKFTDKIKHKPYSVILFDEIDKAHPEVFNILLQILDEGHLTDATGKKINFKNTIIVMTSNLGNEPFRNAGFGFQDGKPAVQIDAKKSASLKNSVLKTLSEHFRPEFLNRLDSILVFKPLLEKDLEKIVELKIAELNERLIKKNLALSISNDAAKILAKQAGEREEGARGIGKIIQKEVEEKLAEWLLQNQTKKKQAIKINAKKNAVLLEYV